MKEAHIVKKVFLFLLVLSMIPLSGCNEEKTVPVDVVINDVQVNFITNGGSIVDFMTVEVGNPITMPTDPVYEDYNFLGWYDDISLSSAFDFNTVITEDTTLYAKWEYKYMFDLADENIVYEDLPYYEYMNQTNPVITIVVDGVGIMVLELFPEVAPITVDNFISYIQTESFTGSTFHRVIKNFMIQGGIVEDRECVIKGEFTANGVDNPLNHYRGVLSTARTQINDSATSQFFIVHGNSLFLDGNYAAFGGLIGGFEVLDYIATVSTVYPDKPLNDITISSIVVDLNGYIPSERVCAN